MRHEHEYELTDYSRTAGPDGTRATYTCAGCGESQRV